jgi:hypothetical protein
MIKIFEDYFSDSLEREVNIWLKSSNIEVIKIMYQFNNYIESSSRALHICFIYYKEL